MNKLQSLHPLGFFLTLFVPFIGVFLHVTLYYADALMPGSTLGDMSLFYACVVMWWIFAVIVGLHPEKKHSDIRFTKWLLLLPFTVIIFNTAFDGEVQFEKMLWFNSVVATWVLALGWISLDWYRWKFNPTPRQQQIIKRREYIIKRQAEIDKIPDCVVPSGLELITE